MLNVGQLNEGVVLDHIKAGKSMTIYRDLQLDRMDCCVAIIKNARSALLASNNQSILHTLCIFCFFCTVLLSSVLLTGFSSITSVVCFS